MSYKVAAVMPSWRGADLLKIAVPAFKKVSTADLIVVLNEADEESIKICDDNDVLHIDLKSNWGTSAVDFAISRLLAYDFVLNINSDMLMLKGWEEVAVKTITENYPATCSFHLVEVRGCPSNITSIDDMGWDETIGDRFNDKYKDIRFNKVVGWTHPICSTVESYLRVGGYSYFLDRDFFPGHSLDTFFAFRLKHLNNNHKFIVSEMPIYHLSNRTNERLPKDINNKHNSGFFKKLTGMTIQDFEHATGYMNLI